RSNYLLRAPFPVVTSSISLETWLDFLGRDYSKSFIADGGASVKFAVPMELTARSHLAADLESTSELFGYMHLSADAADIRFPMIDAIFFSLSGQVPWSELCRSVIMNLAIAKGYDVPQVLPEGPLADAIADENRLESSWVLKDIRRELVQK